MNPVWLAFAGTGLWLVVAVWNFRARETTPALFWARLLQPIVSILLFGAAIYLLLTKGP